MVLVPDISNPFFSKVIRGIQQSAKERGYNIILGNTMGDEETEYEMADMLHTNQADGIIQLSSRFPLDESEKENNLPLPIVNYCECVNDNSMSTVKLDNTSAAKTMINHLIQMGHKRIGAVTGPAKSPLTTSRLRGYKTALQEARVAFDNSMVIEGDYSMVSGKKNHWGAPSHDQATDRYFLL